MHILELLKRASPDERREIGEIFLSFSDGKDRPEMALQLDTVIEKFRGPAERSLGERLREANNRVRALSDGLRAEGMGHEQLIAAELGRRGDRRSVSEYCTEITGSRLPNSDVV